MNKVEIIAAAAAVSCAVVVPSAAQAQSGWYFSGFGGANVRSDFTTTAPVAGSPYSITLSSKTGYSLGLAVGKEFLPGWRGELELSYGSADISKATASYKGASAPIALSGNVGITYLMGNIWYDCPIGGRWRPYVGGGLGAAFSNSSGSSFSIGSDTVFAGQLGAGMGFDVTPNMTIDFGYRLKDAFNISVPNKIPGLTFSNFDVVDNVFQVGLRVGF